MINMIDNKIILTGLSEEKIIKKKGLFEYKSIYKSNKNE